MVRNTERRARNGLPTNFFDELERKRHNQEILSNLMERRKGTLDKEEGKNYSEIICDEHFCMK